MEDLPQGHEVLEQSHHAHGHHHDDTVPHAHRLRCGTAAALYAVFSIIIGLFSGLNGTEAITNVIAASDQYGYFQAKGLKGDVAGDTVALLKQLETVPGADRATADEQIAALTRRAATENAEKAKIKEKADALMSESIADFRLHHSLSFAAVGFAVAIVLCMLGQSNPRRGTQFLWGGHACALIGAGVVLYTVPWWEILSGWASLF